MEDNELSSLPSPTDWARMAIAAAARHGAALAGSDAVAGLLLQRTTRGTWLGWSPLFTGHGTMTAHDVARQFLTGCSSQGVTFTYTAMAWPERLAMDGVPTDAFALEAWADDPTRIARFTGWTTDPGDGEHEVHLRARSPEALRWLEPAPVDERQHP